MSLSASFSRSSDRPFSSASLTQVLANRDAMALARSALSFRSCQQELGEWTDSKVEQARERRRLLSPKARASTVVPLSLVMRPHASPLTTPPSWRTEWSCTDPDQVRQADLLVDQGLRRSMSDQRMLFKQEVSQKQALEREVSVARSQSWEQQAHGSPDTQAKHQHYQQVWETARSRSAERLKAMERKALTKEQLALQHAINLARAQESSIWSKSQSHDSRADSARRRKQHIARLKAAAREEEHQQLSERRAQTSLRRDLLVDQFSASHHASLERSLSMTQAQFKQRTRAWTQHFQDKARDVSEATAEAERRRQLGLEATSSQLRAYNTARLTGADRKNQEHANARGAKASALEETVASRQAARQRRNDCQREQQTQLQKQQTAAMVTRWWAKELELVAKVTNRLPSVRPDVKDTLGRLKVAV